MRGVKEKEPGPGIASAQERPLFPGRRVLWIGAAMILAVLCASTADILYSLHRTAVRSDGVISAFRHRSHLLDTLRGLMIRSAQSSDSGTPPLESSQLPAAHLEANRILAQFGTSLDASDHATELSLDNLRDSIDHYWASLPDIRKENGRLPEVTQPLPGSQERRQIRHIARQIMNLNRTQQDREEAQLRSEQARLQGELLASSLVSLAIVFALVAGMSYRIQRTETYAERQYGLVLQARSELRSFAARLEKAQEEERRTLSRELHDAFGQTMAAALVELSRIENELRDDDGTRAQLSRVKQDLESSMREIRDIALLLRPSMLDDLGLVPALQWQGREVARRSGIAVRVEADDNDAFLPDAYRTCIYRVVQEALHNIVKHASAKAAVVRFHWATDVLHLSIEDDGKGFRPAVEKGMGLLGMEERVGRLDGHLKIESTVNHGTSLHIELPAPLPEKSESFT